MFSARLSFTLFLLLLLSVTALPVAAGTNYATKANEATTQLHALFHNEWQRKLRENPTFATYIGNEKYNDRWPDVSLEAIKQSHQQDLAVLDALADIDRSRLSPADQLNYDLFKRQYRLAVDGYRFQHYLIPLNQLGGIQLAHLITEQLPFADRDDYEDWIARLESFDTYMAQTIALMKKGIDEGIVPAKVVMQRVPDQYAVQRVDKPENSPFYQPFIKIPATIDNAVALRKQAAQAIAENVLPAYRRFQTFFENTYLPASREEVGVWAIPNGRDYYEYAARYYTTTELTPEEIHQIGLREVERIHNEMLAIIEQVGFDGSFEDFLHYLRTDPRFYYESKEELLQAYRATAKRIDPQLSKLFGKLPRTPYGVKPIPAELAPDTYTAYYMPPAADGSRPGWFNVNLYKPETRPKYEIAVLTSHESVPGHHLQIALAYELENVPKFRRLGDGITAFVEGWALYSERLGYDMGLYDDPYSRFGQLTYDMWRAVRLVVDTGIHSMGWTRQQAIDYFMANAPKSELDITNEVDRYIAWPGQALAYKIGQLRILELRHKAEQALGDDFDIRAFHDTVLEAGALPLDILERRVEAWIAEQEE